LLLHFGNLVALGASDIHNYIEHRVTAFIGNFKS